MSQHWAQRQSDAARQFFVVAIAVFVIGGTLAAALIGINWPPPNAEHATFPLAFVASTGLLIAGSLMIQRARHHVRHERQRKFRTLLALAVVAGTLFVSFQSFGLWSMLRSPIGDAQTGSGAFTFVLTVLHGMHLSVALLFLCYVTVRAYAGRYDHEYYWGVTCCAFFWHVLLIVWIVLLVVYAISF